MAHAKKAATEEAIKARGQTPQPQAATGSVYMGRPVPKADQDAARKATGADHSRALPAEKPPAPPAPPAPVADLVRRVGLLETVAKELHSNLRAVEERLNGPADGDQGGGDTAAALAMLTERLDGLARIVHELGTEADVSMPPPPKTKGGE